MPTSSRCAACGHTFSVGTSLRRVTFGDSNRRNANLQCPRCGADCEAAPSSGTYSTVGGRLQRVADQVAHASRSEVEDLREEVERLKQSGDAASAADFMIRNGWAPPSDRSRLTTTNEALDVLIKLSVVLGILVAGGTWTAEHAYALFSQWFG